MKAALSFIFLLVALTASASPGQPYFVRRVSASTTLLTPTNFPGLMYWWVASDTTNNANVTNWVDRIQGAVMSQTNVARMPLSTTNGVQFSGGQILTNFSSIASDYPAAYLVIMRFSHSAGSQMLINDANDGAFGAQGMSIDSANQLHQVVSLTTGNKSGPIAPDSIFDFCIIPQNVSSVLHPYIYTNGISDGYEWNESGFANTIIKAFGADAKYEPPHDFLTGYIQEIAIWTNSLASLNTNWPVTMSDSLHLYSVNKYPGSWWGSAAFTLQPVSVVCLSNSVVSFSAVASGTPAPSYSWKTNGVALSDSALWAGTTTSNLWVTNNGTLFTNLDITCDAYNIYGTNTSQTAYLNIIPDAITNGLAGWWKFNEGSGTNLTDSSTYAHSGAATNAAWATNSGNICLYFNGVNSYVNVSDADQYSVGNGMTVAAFVNVDVLPTAGVDQQAFLCAKATAGNYEWGLAINNYSDSYGKFSPHIWNAAASAGTYHATTLSPATNVWYHICCVYPTNYFTASSGPGTYINAVTNGGSFGNYGGSSSSANGTASLVIGSGAGKVFKGYMRDFRIYNRVLTTNEINQIYLFKP